MAEWELTDEEKITAIRKGISDITDATQVAQAQAKKLVEWLDREEMLVHITNFEETCWEECMACELKRQVGLE